MTINTISQYSQKSRTPSPAQGSARTWGHVHAETRHSIVAIQAVTPFAFDARKASTSNATGFVVDSDLGIILSNRHVMGAGPGIHKATFDTDEYVYLQPVHYDPIHDFAFFRYDPTALKRTRPKSIRLFPEGARPGVPFQLIGNVSSEKMSVCSGTMSQVNRNVPLLSIDRDSNTIYIQASTTSACGSSGSPVLDINGDAVALNAAKNIDDSASFFLPLERVVYSLEYIKCGKHVPRGTLQTVFLFEPYQMVKYLGLSEKGIEESRLANPTSEGMLVVDKVIRNGPVDGVLEAGDVVISINGMSMCNFVGLESILDANVGNIVDLVVHRRRKLVSVSVRVQDMYEFMPTQVLSVGMATLHSMSYMLAQNYSAAIFGVYIANTHEEFLNENSVQTHRVITSVNEAPTPNIKAFIRAFQSVPVGQSMVIRARDYRNPHSSTVFVTRLPETSGPFRLFTRCMKSGFWSEERIDMRRDTALFARQLTAGSIVVQPSVSGIQPEDGNSSMGCVWKSIVHVSACIENAMEGYFGGETLDNGFVLDKARGIVVCSAAAFRGSASKISVIIQNTFQVPATVVYIHPLYPVIFVKYDPAELDQAVDSLVDELSIPESYWSGKSRLTVGQNVTLCSLTKMGGQQISKTQISDRYLYENDMMCESHGAPYYYNVDMLDISSGCHMQNRLSGVLCSSEGHSLGLWIQMPRCYSNHIPRTLVGLDVSLLRHITIALQNSSKYPDIVRTLNARFTKISFLQAREFGLSDSWITPLSTGSVNGNYVFQVKSIDIKSSADNGGLEVGDIVLSIDERPVRQIDDVALIYGKSHVNIVILRQNQEMTISVTTTHPHETRTSQYIRWSGISIQEPYASIYRIASVVPSRCFIDVVNSGSLAAAMKCRPCFITEVNDEKVDSMEDLFRVIRELKVDGTEFNAAVATGRLAKNVTVTPGCDVKLRLVNMKGEVSVFRFRTDDQYLKTWYKARGRDIGSKWIWGSI